MADWKPIETAPKDGSVVLGFCPLDSEYDELPDVFPVRFNDKTYANSWYLQTVEGDENRVTPTHWMPLPTPPKENEALV